MVLHEGKMDWWPKLLECIIGLMNSWDVKLVIKGLIYQYIVRIV